MVNSFRNLVLPILDDDSLLNVFDFCWPGVLDEGETDEKHILQPGVWARERWWYKFAQVCRRWRYLILGSASRLGLCLLRARGTPVEDMLAHSPPLPLVIDHISNYPDITTKDEEGILFALQHHDRVRRIRFAMPALSLQRFIVAMGKEFPILEYLFIDPLIYNDIGFTLPETFQAPRLLHIALPNCALKMGSTLLATLKCLVTLSLDNIPPSAQLSPNDLLQWVSLMPHLQTLQIYFYSPAARRDVEGLVLVMPIMTPVTLPNLRWFEFKGISAYLGALLPWIRTPLLEKLQITFFNQLTFSIPTLPPFVGSTENLKFASANLRFDDNGVNLEVYPRKGTQMYALCIRVLCPHHDWQVSSAAQILGVLGPLFPSVVDLMLAYEEHTLSSEWHTNANIMQWGEVLRSFNNVNTLHVPNGLIKELSGSLTAHDGLRESPMELLPELEELRYDAGGGVSGAFVAFLDVRRKAGRPFTLVPIKRDTIPQNRGHSDLAGLWSSTRRAQPGVE